METPIMLSHRVILSLPETDVASAAMSVLRTVNVAPDGRDCQRVMMCKEQRKFGNHEIRVKFRT
jgi:hypothetical protein